MASQARQSPRAGAGEQEMTPLAEPVPAAVLSEQLTADTLITRFKDLEVHMFEGSEAPAVLDEVGRIREQEYRSVGAGRNVARDLDRFDREHPAYRQIVSFDRAEGEVVALYRAIRCGWAVREGGIGALRTSALFEFADRFAQEELPRLVELGRSVVNREARRAVQGLFSVWSGLGALICEWPEILGFFGNVSVYRDTTEQQLDTLLRYLYAHHGDRERRVTARPESARPESARPAPVSGPGPHAGSGAAAAEPTFDALLERASHEGWEVPPILVSYLKAGPGLVAFDVAVDRDFGDAREIAIMVPVAGITAKTRKRVIDPYVSVNPGRFRWG